MWSHVICQNKTTPQLLGATSVHSIYMAVHNTQQRCGHSQTFLQVLFSRYHTKGQNMQKYTPWGWGMGWGRGMLLKGISLGAIFKKLAQWVCFSDECWEQWVWWGDHTGAGWEEQTEIQGERSCPVKQTHKTLFTPLTVCGGQKYLHWSQ